MISGNEKCQAIGAARNLNFHSPNFKNCFTIFPPSARTLFMHKHLHHVG